MGETRQAKSDRLSRAAEALRQKQQTTEQPPDAQEAFRIGYNTAVSGLVGTRDLAPFTSPALRRQWRRGFDAGRRGLAVKLPPGSVLRPANVKSAGVES